MGLGGQVEPALTGCRQTRLGGVAASLLIENAQRQPSEVVWSRIQAESTYRRRAMDCRPETPSPDTWEHA